MQNSPYEVGGIAGPNQQALIEALRGSGGTAGVQVPGMQSEAPAPIPTPQAAPSDYSRLSGAYNRDKLNDPTHNTAKYQMGHVLDAFDPRQGFTPDVIAGLNAKGLANFSGSGQKLSMHGVTDAGRAAGLQGDYDNADFIEGFSGGNGKWQYADPFTEAREAQSQPQARGGGMPMGNINGMLHGDAQANIQQALGSIQQPGMLQQLIAALGGQ